METIKTAELTGAALDWAVSIAEGFKPDQLYIVKYHYSPASIYTVAFDDEGNPEGYTTGPDRMYSQKWEAGGPIIEREKLSVWHEGGGEWHAKTHKWADAWQYGETPLIAAMRCYVASKLGDIVGIPKELTQ